LAPDSHSDNPVICIGHQWPILGATRFASKSWQSVMAYPDEVSQRDVFRFLVALPKAFVQGSDIGATQPRNATSQTFTLPRR
jgi:hypothetical protein